MQTLTQRFPFDYIGRERTENMKASSVGNLKYEKAEGATVIATNFSYSIYEKRNRTEKKILHDISFFVKPGQLMAIMGPSGAGKTTFLNALAGRLRKQSNATMSGEIRYNGEVGIECIRKISNYVTQDDFLLDFLTVRESLDFSATIRLPNLTKRERDIRVEQILEEFALSNCQHVIVGGAKKKGISGGQRKRLSIAIEMLDDPPVLFLDEPTSGLDSSLAYDVLKLLMGLARSNRTVICTVHQPRSQVFALFDHLMLLSVGRVVFQGPAAEAGEYFTSIGHPCPSHFNPADFYLDLISVNNSAKTDAEFLAEEISRRSLSHSFSSADVSTEDILKLKSTSSVVLGRVIINTEEILALPAKFESSPWASLVHTAIENDLKEKTIQAGGPSSRKQNEFCLSENNVRKWFKTYAALTHRTFLNNMRNPMVTITQLIVHTSFGVLMGGIFFQLSRKSTNIDDTKVNITNILGYIFFVTSQFAFANMDTLIGFPKERIIFNRDSAIGLYTPSAYFLAKMTADMLFQHIAPMIFAILAYFLAGLGNSASQFFSYCVMAFVCIFASASYFYMIATATIAFEIANVAAPFGGVLFMLLGGYFLKDDSIPAWIAWFRYLNYLRYSFFSMVQNEFRAGGSIGQDAGLISNEEVLSTVARIPNNVGMWGNTCSSFLLGCGYRCIAFLFLKLLHRGHGVTM